MSFGTHRPMESTKPSFHERFVNGSSAGLHVFRDQRSLTPGRRHARAVAPSSLVAIAAFACILVLQAKAVVISCSGCPKDCGKKDCQCAGGLSLGDIELTIEMTQQEQEQVEKKLNAISLPKDLEVIGPIPNDLMPLYEEKKQLMALVGKTYQVVGQDPPLSGSYHRVENDTLVKITAWQPFAFNNFAGKTSIGYKFEEVGEQYGRSKFVVANFPAPDADGHYLCKDAQYLTGKTYHLKEIDLAQPNNTSFEAAGMNAGQEAGAPMEESKTNSSKIEVAGNDQADQDLYDLMNY